MSAENPSVVFCAAGSVDIESRAIPEPGPSDMLIRSICSLISAGTELTLLSGSGSGREWRRLTEYPFVPGYANVGEVIAVGEAVDPSWIGATVHNHGRHQAFTISPADRVTRLPPGIEPEEATFASLAKVAMNGLRRARLTWGESVAVVGLGIIGQLACRLCVGAGAHRVFAVDRAAYRLGLLPQHPRVIAYVGDVRDATEHLEKQNGGRLLDLVVEATGNPEAIAAEPLLLRPGGRVLVVSSPIGSTEFDFHDLCNRNSITIVGAHGFSHPPVPTVDNPWTSRRHGELFLERLSTGELGTAALISHRFDYRDAAQAYDVLVRDREQAMGVVLRWPDPA